jgi:hypothetical protein
MLVGYVGLYVMFNTLNRGRDLDSKLYKAVLAVRTKVITGLALGLDVVAAGS